MVKTRKSPKTKRPDVKKLLHDYEVEQYFPTMPTTFGAGAGFGGGSFGSVSNGRISKKAGGKKKELKEIVDALKKDEFDFDQLCASLSDFTLQKFGIAPTVA